MTVAELLISGVPAILVPLPGAPRDHQTRNAEAMVAQGAAVHVPDAECTGGAWPPSSMRSCPIPTGCGPWVRRPAATHTPTRRPGSQSWSTPMPADHADLLDLGEPRRVHIVGIGGAGMSAIALVLRGHGPSRLGLGPQGLTGGGAPALPRASPSPSATGPRTSAAWTR